MTEHILYCRACKQYTMKEICPACAGKTQSVKPAKFSPEDKWGEYRRAYKKGHKPL